MAVALQLRDEDDDHVAFVTFDTGRHQWERSDVLGMGAEIAAVLSRRLGCVTTAYVVEFG